ncbi:SDR family NAD(P)-dependent oxidoreductase [Furfurilactobacillus siliginis]|uniref:Short-chain dehydrogenase n=1 Tax=Furfurilactobacillus siliginis TaxID=348151 RepID=A0A0R2L4I2_9LACO|nr:SDR family NAD(P)-dependent oxidoreductase [Furfurilactobacillus siliginis]KRN96680.1 short-chain dehydrogenase [Furfurilactobacillus siliginis]GEK29110.1 short-chain dehydrogenase/reductase [Furfurilactobacillus siliginis]
MTMKTMLVTGVSSGVGLVTATKLAEQGHQVIGLARHATTQATLTQLGVELYDVDLANNQAIKATMATILSKHDHIDALLNIAGFAANGPLELVTDEQAKAQLEVNVLGVMRLIRAVLPTMRNQQSGTIVNVSSVMGQAYQPMLGWYAATKHALEVLTDTLRVEVAPFGIKVTLVEPNGIATPMSSGEAHFQKQFANSAYENLAQKMDALFKTGGTKSVSAESVADLIIKSALIKHPRPRYAIGYLAKTMMGMARFLPSSWYDKGLQRLLK